MIRLILVRHGNTFEEGQVPVQVGSGMDLALTDRGKQQAELMARFLVRRQIQPDAIYAGNLKRQTEFGEIIAEHFKLPVQYEPALTEIDYGAWEGLSASQIEQLWPQEYKLWNEEAKWPHSLFRASEKYHLDLIDLWFSSLKKNFVLPKTIVAVTSNGILRFLPKENKSKVKTGHFCELHLFDGSYEIKQWNVDPSYTETNNFSTSF